MPPECNVEQEINALNYMLEGCDSLLAREEALGDIL